MELRHIRYFLAVADERNFTRAAARLGIGQPPLSQQIRDLEAEIGAALFQRVPHGAELTAAGAAFRQVVQEMPEQAARGVVAARRAARGDIGALRVGFTGSAIFNPMVAQAVRQFRRGYPDVLLSLQEANSIGLAEDLLAGELDVAFLRPGAALVEPLQLRALPEEAMVAVVPASHPMALEREVPLIALRHDRFLLTPRESGPSLFDTVLGACRAAGFEAQLGQPAPQLGSIINLVAAELGVTLAPASLRAMQVTGVAMRPIAGGGPRLQLSLAYRRGETSRAVWNFAAGLMPHAEDHATA